MTLNIASLKIWPGGGPQFHPESPAVYTDPPDVKQHVTFELSYEDAKARAAFFGWSNSEWSYVGNIDYLRTLDRANVKKHLICHPRVRVRELERLGYEV